MKLGQVTINARKHLLDTAESLVNGDRNAQYGDPRQDFKRTATMWSAYLGTDVQPHDVAALMSLLKLSRIRWSPHKFDSWADLAGYAACGWDCVAPDEIDFTDPANYNYESWWDSVETTDSGTPRQSDPPPGGSPARGWLADAAIVEDERVPPNTIYVLPERLSRWIDNYAPLDGDWIVEEAHAFNDGGAVTIVHADTHNQRRLSLAEFRNLFARKAAPSQATPPEGGHSAVVCPVPGESDDPASWVCEEFCPDGYPVCQARGGCARAVLS